MEHRKRQNYTREFKEDAVKLVVEEGYSATEAGRRLGVHQNNISRWVREYRLASETATEGGKSPRDLKDENRRLKKENDRLRMEREILKKATAFFAKESS